MINKYDIFISYSRNDLRIVNEVVQELQLQGFTTWMNLDSICIGQHMVFETIENAKAILFFSSKESNKSSSVESEICTAIDLNKTIIVVKLDHSDYNTAFASGLESYDAYNYSNDKFGEELASVIDKKIKEDFSWVFISHSTKDFEIVRLVRNALEKSGRRPILFYLKCLSNKEEVNGLLKREIDARHRFVLCESKNARASEYVREEVEYIQSKNRMFETIELSEIDLESPNVEQEILDLIKPFERRTTVFISYSRNDQDVASKLNKQLNRVGFEVWDADFYFDMMPGTATGQDWSTLIKQSIRATLDKGYVIALLGDNHSGMSIEEIKYAYEIAPSRVLPVTLSNREIPEFMRKYNVLDISDINSDVEKARAITEALISLDLRNSK